MVNFKLKFIYLLLPPLILGTILVSALSAYVNYEKLHHEMVDKQKSLAETFSSALVGPMWNFEESEIERLLNALSVEKDVVQATVYNSRGEMIRSVGSNTEDGLQELDVQILHKGQFKPYPLGVLKVKYSEERIISSLWVQAQHDGLLLLIIVAICVIAATAVNRFIVQELEKQVTDRTRHLAHEIQQRKEVEEQLQLSHRIIETSPDNISLLSTDFIYQYINPAYEKMFGIPREDIVGMHASELLGKEIYERSSRHNLEKCMRGEDVRFEGWFHWQNGHHNYMTVNYLPICNDDKQVVGIAVLAHDITPQKEAEDEHRKAKEMAENVSRTKSQFLAAASHDLRQPLQAIGMLVAALEQSIINGTAANREKQLSITHSIDRSVESLRDLLGSLLDLSRLDAGVVHVSKSEFPIQDILSEVGDNLKIIADKKGLNVHVVPSRASVHADKVLLRQILENLTTNAVKYTDEGKILLGCRLEKDHLRVEVWDTGLGIRENDLQDIFEEFRQLDNPARQKEKGLGLGLAIVKRTAQMMGADINVRSTYRKGSVFSVRIPLIRRPRSIYGETTRALYGEDAEGSEHKVTLLVVDDDLSVLEGTVLVLESWGYKVYEAADAQQAMDMVKHRGLELDGIVVDYQLPGDQDGLELYQSLMEQQKRYIPGIVISGATTPFALEKFERCGLMHMTKPIAPDALKENIEFLMDNEPQGSA